MRAHLHGQRCYRRAFRARLANRQRTLRMPLDPMSLLSFRCEADPLPVAQNAFSLSAL